MKIVINILIKILKILIIPFIIFLIWYIIHISNYTHIKAEFDELTPFSTKIPIYFKGFKIGKITKIKPKDDFTKTVMNITLFIQDIKFPNNSYLQIRSYKKNFMYGEMIIPPDASDKKLKDGDTIQGRTNMSFETILQRQAENGSFDLIIVTLGDIMVNINDSAKELNALLKDVRMTFKNSENYITLSTRNLSQATGHLTRASVNISSTVDQKTLDRTMKNLEGASENLKNLTKNIDCATRNLSKTMDNVESISENVDGITNSVNCTMKDRFGGIRLFFGKASQNCKCKKDK